MQYLSNISSTAIVRNEKEIETEQRKLKQVPTHLQGSITLALRHATSVFHGIMPLQIIRPKCHAKL